MEQFSAGDCRSHLCCASRHKDEKSAPRKVVRVAQCPRHTHSAHVRIKVCTTYKAIHLYHVLYI